MKRNGLKTRICAAKMGKSAMVCATMTAEGRYREKLQKGGEKVSSRRDARGLRRLTPCALRARLGLRRRRWSH